jgi:hypothetical protein
MAHHHSHTSHQVLSAAFENPDASVRLAAALGAGTNPDPAQIALLVTRCAIEPDFFVRDMLTWALTRHAQASTLPLLLEELRSRLAQARSQALHTLSKIGNPATWPAITTGHLHDPDPEVARTAWRTAAALAPAEQRAALALELVRELGRGDKDLKRSLSRALLLLGDDALAPLDAATRHADPAVRVHARASLRLIADPESAFVLDPADALDRSQDVAGDLVEFLPARFEPGPIVDAA